MPESPKFHYERGEYDKARDSLDFIAHENRVEFFSRVKFDREQPLFSIVDSDSIISFEHISSGNASDQQQRTTRSSHRSLRSAGSWTQRLKQALTPSEIWSIPHLRQNLLVLIVQWTCCSFISYVTLYQLKYFKGNIFYNSMALYIGHALSIMVGYVMMKKWGVRATFIRCYALSVASVLCIYVMQTFFADSVKSKQRSIANTFMPILLMIAESGI